MQLPVSTGALSPSASRTPGCANLLISASCFPSFCFPIGPLSRFQLFPFRPVVPFPVLAAPKSHEGGSAFQDFSFSTVRRARCGNRLLPQRAATATLWGRDARGSHIGLPSRGLNPAWRKCWSVVKESRTFSSCISPKLTQSVKDHSFRSSLAAIKDPIYVRVPRLAFRTWGGTLADGQEGIAGRVAGAGSHMG